MTETLAADLRESAESAGDSYSWSVAAFAPTDLDLRNQREIRAVVSRRLR